MKRAGVRNAYDDASVQAGPTDRRRAASRRRTRPHRRGSWSGSLLAAGPLMTLRAPASTALFALVLVACGADDGDASPSATRPTRPSSGAPDSASAPSSNDQPAADSTSPASSPSARPTCTAQIGAPVGDWSTFGDGQCLVAVQSFYPAKFNASVPVARGSYTGACAPAGACHIWLDDMPDPAKWERIENDGTALPSTYDLIVFPPTATNAYGHIASVDRVEGGKIYVMDANWNLDERKAAEPHVVSGAYGWYHLKGRPKTSWCSAVPLPADVRSQPCPTGDGLYCGSNGIKGDPTLLYRCAGGKVTLADACATTCEVRPTGEADRCK